MAVQKGDPAPAIKLPAKPGDVVEARIGQDKVVLLFFPLAFSPVCTDEMCHMRDTWSQWEGLDAQVLGISVDSPFVTDRFRAELPDGSAAEIRDIRCEQVAESAEQTANHDDQNKGAKLPHEIEQPCGRRCEQQAAE